MKLWVCVFVITACLGATEARGQVRQGKPEDLASPSAVTEKEVPSPMLIDISLGTGTSPAGKPRKSLNETPAGVTRAYNDAAGYVCDKARISVVLVRKEERRGGVRLTASPALSTDWVRQHVNLTAVLLADGKEVKRQRWEDLVIGATKGAAVNALGTMAMGIGTSNSKAPAAEWDFGAKEWEELWRSGSPTLRIILEVRE